MQVEQLKINSEITRLRVHPYPIVINPYWSLYQAAVQVERCIIIFTPTFWQRFSADHPEIGHLVYPNLNQLIDTRGEVVYQGSLSIIEEQDAKLMREFLPSTLPTIVTALYPIRALEGNQSDKVRSMDTYLEKGKWIASLPYPMVIYTQAELVDAIYALRKPYITITRIVVEPIEETYFYRYKDVFTNHPYPIHNRNPDKDTPLYIIFNANKFHWLERTITTNPFNSNHFLWMDLGITHVAENPAIAYTWLSHIPDKIRQMELMIPYFGEPPSEHFHYIRHNVAGGLFSGNRDYLQRYIKAFKAKYDEIITAGWYQLDEAVMTFVLHEHPDWFDLFYGDYNGIVQNYRAPHTNIDAIIRGIVECIHRREYGRASHRLDYLLPLLDVSMLQYYFEVDHIIQPDKRLRPEVMEYIWKLKLTEPDIWEQWCRQHEELLPPYQEQLNVHSEQE